MPHRRRRPNAIRMRLAIVYIFYMKYINASVTENNINDKVKYAYDNIIIQYTEIHIIMLCVLFYVGIYR